MEKIDYKVKNPEIVDKSKDIVVFIGCPGLTGSRFEIAGLIPISFDNAHPKDQINTVRELLDGYSDNKKLKEAINKVRQPIAVFTYSPFVLQSFFHFTGRDLRYIAYYECGFNETGDLLLTNVSCDTRAAFARMADALGEIMDMSEKLLTQREAEIRPKFIRFTKEIDYWLGDIEFDGKFYDQIDDDNAWDNFKRDWPQLINDKDELCLMIDIDNGHIEDWSNGHTASFGSVKIVDTGHYELLDSIKCVIKKLDGYVPKFLGDEYGDYLEFDIDSNGYIKDWTFTQDDLNIINEKWSDPDD